MWWSAEPVRERGWGEKTDVMIWWASYREKGAGGGGMIMGGAGGGGHVRDKQNVRLLCSDWPVSCRGVFTPQAATARSDTAFTHVNFLMIAFTHVNFLMTAFTHVNFLMTAFTHANFLMTVFTHVNFLMAAFAHAIFLMTAFTHVNFLISTFTRVNFLISTFTHVNFLMIAFTHVNFHMTTWLERRARDRKVAGSNPCWRIFFSRVINFLCWLLFRYPFHPRVTAVARERPRSLCQKCRWQVATKARMHHTYVALHEVTRCMVVWCTQNAPRRQQFHVAPAMPAL